MKNVLISTGGSGGHVVPAKIIYEHLKEQFNISLTSDQRGIKFLDKDKYNIEIINVPKVSKNIFLSFLQIFLLFNLFFKSFFFYKKKKNRNINIYRWIYVFTLVSSIKSSKNKIIFI